MRLIKTPYDIYSVLENFRVSLVHGKCGGKKSFWKNIIFFFCRWFEENLQERKMGGNLGENLIDNSSSNFPLKNEREVLKFFWL